MNFKKFVLIINNKKEEKWLKSKSRISDFKNSKAYWKFYSSSITIKSDKVSDDTISLHINNKVITDPLMIAYQFNKFFTTLDSNSSINLSQSLVEIDNNFSNLIDDGDIKPSIFKFHLTSLSTVSNLIAKMDINSNPFLTLLILHS